MKSLELSKCFQYLGLFRSRLVMQILHPEMRILHLSSKAVFLDPVLKGPQRNAQDLGRLFPVAAYLV